MAETVRLGDENGLEFQLESLPYSEQYPEGLAWAAFSVSLGGQAVWFSDAKSEDTVSRLVWTLADLLQGLGRIWPWLLLEEGYPLPIDPEHPGYLWNEAERRWQDVPVSQADHEAEVLYSYRQRHDLSLLLRGMHVPPLWVLKEGLDCLVWTPAVSEPLRISHALVMATLTDLGEWIVTQLESVDHPRGKHAVAQWHSRQAWEQKDVIALITGLESDEIQQIIAQDDVLTFFELGDVITEDFQPNELLMAARMTRHRLDWAAQRQLLDTLRQVPAAITSELDRLGDLAQSVIRAEDPPWQQGYDLANWLRSQLGFDSAQAVDPRDILLQWRVGMSPMHISGSIDAAAVWGMNRGPHILWNEHEYSRASTSNGLRTALAHEICHLLIDRQRALPVVEVLGGQVSVLAEKRANAFAAELLLPREHAAQVCRDFASLSMAANRLETSHRVSRDLVYNQIWNSSFHDAMSGIERRQLDNWRLSGLTQQ